MAEVVWEDAAVTYGWEERPPETCPAAMNRSVGYLTRCDRKFISITQSSSANGDWAETTVIPRANVTRLKIFGRSTVRLKPSE